MSGLATAVAAIGLCAVAAGSAAARGPASGWDAVVARYAGVRDYTCLYVKEERAISNGEPQRIRLSFRRPFDVRMEWLDARGTVDQVAVYRRGFNDGKLVAHRNGMLGSIVGTVRLDPHDRRALGDSRHPITEAGLGPLVEAIAQAVAGGALAEKTDGAAFEWTVRPGASLLGLRGAARVRVRIDPASGLPADVEVRDAAGALLERHRFSELAVNTGLADSVFTL